MSRFNFLFLLLLEHVYLHIQHYIHSCKNRTMNLYMYTTHNDRSRNFFQTLIIHFPIELHDFIFPLIRHRYFSQEFVRDKHNERRKLIEMMPKTSTITKSQIFQDTNVKMVEFRWIFRGNKGLKTNENNTNSP